MNPDIPQEVRIVNAIAEQLFDVWPVSIVMIDLEDRIWRVNKQMSDELQLDTDIIGKSVFDLLEVVQDKQNVLPRYLQELHEGCQRIIPLSSNCFIYEQKRHISFLIQGALIGVYEEERLVRIVLYYRNVLEERTQKHLLNIALSRTQIFQWSYDLERNLMIIDPGRTTTGISAYDSGRCSADVSGFFLPAHCGNRVRFLPAALLHTRLSRHLVSEN